MSPINIFLHLSIRRRRKKGESESEKKPDAPQGDNKLISEEVAEQGGVSYKFLYFYTIT